MIRRRNTTTPLLMYPRLNAMGLELWFHSMWHGQSVDGLGPWPICRWCPKFHLPYDGPGSHRQSQQHTKFREYYMKPALNDPSGDSVKKLRETVIGWGCDREMFM